MEDKTYYLVSTKKLKEFYVDHNINLTEESEALLFASDFINLEVKKGYLTSHTFGSGQNIRTWTIEGFSGNWMIPYELISTCIPKNISDAVKDILNE